MENCPICYEPMTDINVCVTVCKHKFHTNCLMRCNNMCPICRANVGSDVNFQIEPTDDVSDKCKQWIEDCKKYNELINQEEEQRRQSEQKFKNNLKKADINKYNLFYN